jgi:16S rRNA (guanine966-N2)-methyltransferase
VRANRPQNQLRIIGGRWRGRRLVFAPVPGLRPTSDRVRETLFNWLAPVIAGSRCLDLYAGSGALGLEAVSRGAAEVVLVDSHARVTDCLQEQLRQLQTDRARVVQADAMLYLRGEPHPFDIVFLDPPFREGLLDGSIRRLEAGGWLSAEAWIYLESERGPQPDLPPNWAVHRSKTAGQVACCLIRRSGSRPESQG